MGVYSATVANAYADKIKIVYEYLGEIRKVADRLTPVEDLASFQAQIETLYAQLDLLVEASNIIVAASPTGEAILTGSVASIQALLEIGIIPDDVVRQADLDAALAALSDSIGDQLAGLHGSISTIDLTLDQLDQYRVLQQSTLDGLQISYENVAAGLETNQTNVELALSRLTVQEQFATLVDERLDLIDQDLLSTMTGLSAANSTLSGHTAEIDSFHNSISLHTASIDQLSSNLVDLNNDVTANTTALSLMETTITGLGEDIVAQSQQTTALRSVIGGSGNLLANADFAAGANGWSIVVAEEDWAATVLTIDTFGMPEDVHCLEVLGTPTPLGQIVVESPPVLLEGNKHYLVSGYPCVDNGTVSLSYKTFDEAGAVLDQGICPATFNATTSLLFNEYTRTWVKFLASADAVKLRLYLTVTGDGDWIVQGALFRPMVEQSWADQAGPSAWTPNVSGVPEALAEAVQTLTTEVSDINGQLTAQAGQITTLQSQVSTLPTVYLQADMPLGSAYNVGDIWFETDNGNKQYIWNGTLWGDTASISGAVNYAQSTEPTGGSYNVGDQWIDTSDNNRLYHWNGTAWIDVSDTRITTTATALSALTTRVTNAEGVNTSQAMALTSLDSRLDSAEGVNTSQATAISGLTTRVTDAENELDAQSSDITSLTATVADKASSAALSALTARVTDAEGDIDTASTAITNLTATVGTKADSSAVTALEARVTSTESVNTSQASAITAIDASVDGANASITSLAQVVASAAVGNALVNPGFEDGADHWLLSATNALVATHGSARSGAKVLILTGGVGAASGFARSTDLIPVITGQTVKFGMYVRRWTDVIAPVGAYCRINVQWFDKNKVGLSYVATNCSIVTTALPYQKVIGSQVAPVGAAYFNVTIVTNATSGNFGVDDVTVEPLTDLAAYTYASSGVTLDVNGYMTGYRQFNDGTTSGFTINSAFFSIVSPGGGARTEYSSGNWRVYDAAGTMRVRMGVW